MNSQKYCDGEWEKWKIEYKIDEPGSNHTSLRVGGKIDLVLWISNDDQLRYVLEFSKKNNCPLYVLGRGSNVLIRDGGIRGIVVILTGIYRLKSIVNDGRQFWTISIGAGVTLANAGSYAMKNNLTGMECLSSIPGTLGGALLMNAGAGGQEIGDVVESVQVMDWNGGIFNIPKGDIQFEYRGSSLKGKMVILGAKLKLPVGKKKEIMGKIVKHVRWRKNSQPLKYPSAGSVFKNPPGYSAGQLIESAGLKGKRIGNAQISDTHSNFIINRGGAKASDVLGLIDLMKNRVFKEKGVKLELEIKAIG